jgi:hypothetical protein
MVALLRHIYELPYDTMLKDQCDRLQPHAMVYVVAEKYQVDGLKRAISQRMNSIIESHLDIRDFVKAYRTIAESTTRHDAHARKMMVGKCITRLHHLHRDAEFISLLREHADLGVDMIEHQDLPRAFPEERVCAGTCNDTSMPVCYDCGEFFSDAFASKHRYTETWGCEECEYQAAPVCTKCGEYVVWQRRGL